MPAILIVCDGEKTETLYFESLRRELRGSVVIKVDSPKGGDCRSTVKLAIADDGLWDQRWCVFDTEASNLAGRVRLATELAKRKGIRVAASNPAFEYWLLLHFAYTIQPFPDAQGVINELRRHLPNYEKSLDVYPLIKDSTQTAIAHAVRVMDDHKRTTDDEFPNPSTHVHKLVQELQRLRQ